MKILNIIQLGFIFAGCFLGAGYVSGQELWQFFGTYGKNGFYGLFFAIILFFIFGCVVFMLSKKTGIVLMDEIVIQKNNKPLKSVVGFLQVFFIIGIYIIMCAGAGALINQLFGLHIIAGSALFCFLVCFISLKGIKGVIEIFSLFVPPLILAAIIVGISVVNKSDFSFYPTAHNRALSPIISAVIYVSYNFFGSIGILAPVAQKYKTKKELISGVAVGCVFLLAISLCILAAMNVMKESISAQLPMLFIATKLNKYIGYTYAVFLLGAMFSTSLSSLVAVCEYVKAKYNFNKRKSTVLTVFLSISSCILSLVGFDILIGTIYPLCGIFGFFSLVAIVVHYINVIKKK